MESKRVPKAMSQTMWIIIAILVAFIVALVLITIFTGTSNKAGKTSSTAINDSGSGMKTQTCYSLCESCKMTYGETGCGAAEWASMAGTCIDIMSSCS